MKNFPFKFVRITILIFILAAVWTATVSQQKNLQDWQGTSDIVIIPIAADNAKTTQNYIDRLTERDFKQIRKFFKREIKRHRPDISHPMSISLAKQIKNIPPETPKPGANKLQIMLWSLKLRWWARQNSPENTHSQQVLLYVLYHKPEVGKRLSHSTGLQKGLIGVIQAFASKQQASQNNLIVAHELLHIYGATDKYDLKTGLALNPQGFAEPNKKNLFPQRFVEIMGRTIPKSQSEHVIGDKLNRAIINDITAQEIGLIKSDE